MKIRKNATLTQILEKCDYPESEMIQSDADSWGMFTLFCPKCNTTFSRYDYDYIVEQRDINSKQVDYENSYRIYQ